MYAEHICLIYIWTDNILTCILIIKIQKLAVYMKK